MFQSISPVRRLSSKRDKRASALPLKSVGLGDRIKRKHTADLNSGVKNAYTLAMTHQPLAIFEDSSWIQTAGDSREETCMNTQEEPLEQISTIGANGYNEMWEVRLRSLEEQIQRERENHAQEITELKLKIDSLERRLEKVETRSRKSVHVSLVNLSQQGQRKSDTLDSFKPQQNRATSGLSHPNMVSTHIEGLGRSTRISSFLMSDRLENTATPKKRLVSNRPVQPAKQERGEALFTQFSQTVWNQGEIPPISETHRPGKMNEFLEPESPSYHLKTHSSTQLRSRARFLEERTNTESPPPSEDMDEKFSNTPRSNLLPSSTRYQCASADCQKLGSLAQKPKLLNSLLSRASFSLIRDAYASSPQRNELPSSVGVSKLHSDQTEIQELMYEEIESMLRPCETQHSLPAIEQHLAPFEGESIDAQNALSQFGPLASKTNPMLLLKPLQTVSARHSSKDNTLILDDEALRTTPVSSLQQGHILVTGPLTSRYPTKSPGKTGSASRFKPEKMNSSFSSSLLAPNQLNRRIQRCKCKSPEKNLGSARGPCGSDYLGSDQLENTEAQNKKIIDLRNVELEDVPQQPCSDYCKHLPPYKQKLIIKEALKLGKHEMKKFLINAEWWRNWKQYVQFEVEETLSTDRSAPQLGRSKFKANSYAELIRSLKQIKPMPTALSSGGAPSPGRIINAELLIPGESLFLKHPLLQHYDFQAVPPTVFRYLRAWYGCDYSVARLLVRDKSNCNSYILDLYPQGLTKKQEKPGISTHALRQISREVREGMQKSPRQRSLPSLM